MAAARVQIELTDSEWYLVEVDPDTDGYTRCLITALNIDQDEIEYSPINTITEPTVTLPQIAVATEDVYIRYVGATAPNDIKIALSRSV